MRYRSANRCEDCGRRPRLGAIYQVEWTYKEAGRAITTWLCLCDRCARVMQKAFRDDASSTLVFHPG